MCSRAQGLRVGRASAETAEQSNRKLSGPEEQPGPLGGRVDPPGLLGFLAQCFGAPRLGWSICTLEEGGFGEPQGLIQAAVRHEETILEPRLRTLRGTAAAPRAGACSGSQAQSSTPGRLMSRTDLRQQ